VSSGKIIVFTCNWNGYSSLESAGKSRMGYSPDVRAVRVACLGRLHPGMILKAFEHGAAGVLMLGCPPRECRYGFGSRSAEQTFARSKALLRLLGIPASRFKCETVCAGDGGAFLEKLETFMAELKATPAG
jgi:F420-non-reducing hydrogenase iron-sulfur subunit